MICRIIIIAVCVLSNFTVSAQRNKDRILLKMDGEPVYQSEFIRLFEKNKSIDESRGKEALQKDLELFVNYKLKLLEAEELQLDSSAAHKKELSKYRDQLALPYLTDNSLIDSLAKQAYNRSLKEIKASHILLKVPQRAVDTLEAYQKIQKLRSQILEGADFSELALQHSEDPSAKHNKGSLGYFSAFRMVYAFENAAYQTNIGEVSPIFRSRYGYHILKVDDIRPSTGKIEVAHIMIKDTTSIGKNRIDKVYRQILDGEVFEELSKKYSDDRRSANKGGKLPKFTKGSYPEPFGEVSFSLSEETPYSKPFRTVFGWHIVKYIDFYTTPSFKDSKAELSQKVKKYVQSSKLSSPFVTRLKKKYEIQFNEPAKQQFENPENWASIDSVSTWLLSIEKDTLSQREFLTYLKTKRNKNVTDLFKTFVDEKVLAYYKEHLEEENVEFRNVFQEYKNGLLLFDLMKLKIWDVAQNDSLGLQNFYKVNVKNYFTKPLVNAIVIRVKNKDKIDSLEIFTRNTADIKAIENAFTSREDIIIKSGDFDKQDAIFPKGVTFVSGTTKTYNEENHSVIVKIFEVSPAVQKSFKEARGMVVSDYQDDIESRWIQSLRDKHTIKIYKNRLRKLKKKMSVYKE